MLLNDNLVYIVIVFVVVFCGEPVVRFGDQHTRLIQPVVQIWDEHKPNRLKFYFDNLILSYSIMYFSYFFPLNIPYSQPLAIQASLNKYCILVSNVCWLTAYSKFNVFFFELFLLTFPQCFLAILMIATSFQDKVLCEPFGGLVIVIILTLISQLFKTSIRTGDRRSLMREIAM